MTVVDLDAERDRRHAEAWARYAAAAEKAHRTLAFADGLAAQHAFRDFLEMGLNAEQLAYVRGTVAPFGKRA